MRHIDEKVVREIMSGEEVSEFRDSSLQSGLEALRRRVRRRSLCRLCALFVAAIFLPGVMLLGYHHYCRKAPLASKAGNMLAHAPATPGGIKIISDEEFLALFPDRTVALIGKKGGQQLVFLGRSSGSD